MDDELSDNVLGNIAKCVLVAPLATLAVAGAMVAIAWDHLRPRRKRKSIQ